jgi:hypothetical protein
VQPARDLISGTAQIAVSTGPDLDDRGPVFCGDGADVARTQGGDGNRAGVVRVVLVDLAGVEQTHPRCELGLHVQHAFTGFSSTVEGNNLTIDEEIAKLSLNVETAAEVWG